MIRDIDDPRPALLVVRQEGGVAAANARAQTLLGRSAGRRCWDVLPGALGARSLPCRPGCDGLGVEASKVELSGCPFTLCCQPVDGQIFVSLTPHGPRCAAEPWERVTVREHDILERLADGESTPEIAVTLGISRSTVRTHVEHMRDKLGARTQAQLVARAYQIGLL